MKPGLFARLHRLRRMNAEGGFGMIELMVTATIILVAVMVMVYLATVAFSDIALARQRQSANGLANQTMEQIRGLPFDVLARGMANCDIAGTCAAADPAITSTGSGASLAYWYAGEQIPRGDNPNVVPLVPHRSTAVVGPTTYSISVYVTYYQGQTNTFRVTVFVSWTNTARKGVAGKVQVQSVFSSPAGCLSTATHPFAAPCQPFLYGNASLDPGNIVVTGTVAGAQLDHTSLDLSGFSAQAQIEQISAVQGTAQTSGAAQETTGNAESTIGMESITSGADNDPGASTLAFSTATSPAQSAQSLTISGGGTTLTANSSAGDTAATTSTVSATTSPANPCPNLFGIANLNDSLPCGGASSQMGGSMNVQLTVTPNGSNNVGTATIASVSAPSCGASPCPNRGIVYRFLAPTGGLCPTTATAGCTHAEAARTLGTVLLGALPTGISAPAGWASNGGYLIRLTNLQDTASAEAGLGVSAPTLSAPVAGTGQLSFWNGTGYTTCTLHTGGCTGVTKFAIPAVTVSTSVDGSPFVLTMSANMKAGGASTSQTPAGCGGATACTQASATSGAPILGDFSYKITYNGTTLVNLAIHVDLGQLIANTTYQAAPSG